MPSQHIFYLALLIATFFSSLVAGLLFVFATVVMPGIRRLNHAEFIRAFQVMDGIIQNNQPLFVLVWLGSVLALIVATILGAAQLTGWPRLLLLIAAGVYLLGVQLPTITINIPLNNELQTLRPETMNPAHQKTARQQFEPRWNRWNTFRSLWASLTSVLLLIVISAL
jgi:uncharacterized membrane protein